jgi:hypothetical protein
MKSNSFIHRLDNNWAPPIYDHLPIWLFPKRPLKFKAYSVGLPKTGTASLYFLFRDYRTYHEPEDRFLIYKLLAVEQGKITRKELTQSIKKRDRRLQLEMDSAWINGYIVDILAEEFKEAKFILGIRDCYSWLDSFINHNLFIAKREQKWSRWQHWRGKYFTQWENFVFKAHQLKHAKPEQILAKNGLYTLEGYLSYWAEHNNKVLTAVPKERLLIVKTLELKQSIPRIENFLGLTPGSLPRDTKINVRKKQDKYNLLSQIDKDFLDEKVNTHCKELMDKFFPEITISEVEAQRKSIAANEY